MIPLSVRSGYSLLAAVDLPEQWVISAKRQGLAALALTDVATLAGIVPFVQAALAHGIHPLCGTTLLLDEMDVGLVLLVKDGHGWSALCQGLSLWRQGDKNGGWQKITAAAESLIALAGSPHWLLRCLRIPAWRKGDHALYARITPPHPSLDSQRSQLLELARHHRIPLVAATDAVSIDEEGLQSHKVVRAMALSTTVHRLTPQQVAPPWARLPDGKLAALFNPYPQAVANTWRVAETCSFLPVLGHPLFPPPPHGVQPEQELFQRTMAGLHRRYTPTLPMEALRRTQRELAVIQDMGYSGYFLLAHEIVLEAMRRGMPILGRGSVANSTVAYALGITHVDPVAHHLFFERFLNPERLDPPDIDLDLPWDRRDEILSFLFERFGQNQVAMIGAFQTFKTRGLIREIGGALGIPREKLGELARRLPGGSLDHLEQVVARNHPVYQNLPLDRPPWRGILTIAHRLAGLPRAFGIHPCGVAVASVPIDQVIPVVPSPSGWPVTDAAMGPAESLGLIKMDLLGNRSMGALCDALYALGLRRTDDPEGGLAPELAMGDPATQQLIASGDTVGCFYIESPSMRGVLKRLACRDFETLTAASSIIRPGVNQGGMLDAFIRRHRGEEAASFADPRLQPFLGETHGILVYQEQVIQTAATVAGMSLGEADLLRRAMGGKRQCESITLHQHRFMAGALAGGMGEDAAFSLWRQISSFAGYAFCKAHSASFARLSFQMAWLRAHHPALFFAMILRHNGGYYHPQTYVDEARRLGIRLLPPCVVHGSWLTEAVDEQTIRLGLQWVRGLNQQAAMEMMGRRPFAHWHAFLARVTLDRESLAMLVLAGATDNLITSSDPLSRQERLWMVESRTRPVAHTLPHLEEGTTTWTPEAEESLEERLQRELQALGLALSDHPLRLFRTHLAAAVGRVISARRLASLQEGMAASCVGLPVAYKSMETKKGEPMCFLTLSDRTGLIETTLFPDMVKRLGAGVRHRGPWWVRGIVEKGSLVVKEATLIAAG